MRVSVCVCVVMFFFSFFNLCLYSTVCLYVFVSRYVLLSAAGPCIHTLGPKNSKQSIVSCEEPLKSTVYALVGPPSKDL